eukprot:2254723-Pleurochrysis_carterae.AAC.1
MESIADVRVAHVNGKWRTQGLVKWKGWDRASDNTWKDLAEINDEELLAQAKACEERQDAEKRAREAAFEHQSSFTQPPVEKDTVDNPTVLSPGNDAGVGDDAAT